LARDPANRSLVAAVFASNYERKIDLLRGRLSLRRALRRPTLLFFALVVASGFSFRGKSRAAEGESRARRDADGFDPAFRAHRGLRVIGLDRR